MNRNHNLSAVVIASIPRYGLCNCLLVWAKAYVFAERHQLPLFVHGWGAVHIGPWLRGERVKRYYGDYFRPQRSLVAYTKMTCLKKSGSKAILVEPQLHADLQTGTKFVVFSQVPSKDDFFLGLRGHEVNIRSGFETMLRPWILKASERLPKPDIAVHIRRGDYHYSGHTLTPIEYYVDQIGQVRQVLGANTPVTIFSDADDDELSVLLELSNVNRSSPQRDVLDILQMASARVIITSLQSTFGYWSGFISKAAIILHPDHRFGRIRGSDISLFEGTGEMYLATHAAL